MIRRLIPNLITLGNLLCGCLAVIEAFHYENPIRAAWFILIGAVLDVFDGAIARALKADSKLGIQLDSLADLVTFGLAPAGIAFVLLLQAGEQPYMAFLPLVMPLAAAYRLGRFNIDPEQSKSFKGLPAPANGIFWIGIAFTAVYVPKSFPILGEWFQNATIIYALTLVMAVLMVSKLPLMALKFSGRLFADNRSKWGLILASVILYIIIMIITKHLFAPLPFVLLLYLIYSIIQSLRKA